MLSRILDELIRGQLIDAGNRSRVTGATVRNVSRWSAAKGAHAGRPRTGSSS